jgi:hypothetical protein
VLSKRFFNNIILQLIFLTVSKSWCFTKKIILFNLLNTSGYVYCYFLTGIAHSHSFYIMHLLNKNLRLECFNAVSQFINSEQQPRVRHGDTGKFG